MSAHRSRPDTPRSRTSSSTASGASRATRLTASPGSLASPATSTWPAYGWSMALRPSRTIWWSSTITSRIGGDWPFMPGKVPVITPSRSASGFEQVPQQQQLGDGQRLIALARRVLAQRVRQHRALVEGELLPDRLLHDPAVLPRRVPVHVQRVHRAAV